jgi:Dimerisation domain
MTASDHSIELMRLINAYQMSQALHVAATLGVADQLREGQKSYDNLAQACGAHPTSLYRLLRAWQRSVYFTRPATRNSRSLRWVFV